MSPKINHNRVETPQTKFQPSPLTDDKMFIFSEFIWHRKVRNSGAEYFKS